MVQYIALSSEGKDNTTATAVAVSHLLKEHNLSSGIQWKDMKTKILASVGFQSDHDSVHYIATASCGCHAKAFRNSTPVENLYYADERFKVSVERLVN